MARQSAGTRAIAAESESPLDEDVTRRLARAIRAHSLGMTHRANASHIGSCLSMADLLAVLYGRVLRVDPSRPKWPDRDRFVLSKGHGAAALYAVLAETGFFPASWLDSYCQDSSTLEGHVTTSVPGVELSTGSLGHGLPVACGMALAGRRDGRSYRVFSLLGDGELDEGSNWEALLFGAHHGLDNLTMIIDRNGIQAFGDTAHVCQLEPLDAKFQAFGWAVARVDGHDLEKTEMVLGSVPLERGKPSAVIAETVKGKGVSFMEGKLEWHYKSPDARQLAQGLAELGLGMPTSRRRHLQSRES